jgi:hypothetical protein
MALTLKQIIARIETLSLSHNRINDFYYGDVWEFDVNGDGVYPSCFLEQLTGSINRAERLHTFIFRVYFLDKINVAENTETNKIDVLSEMSGLADDFVAMLNYSGYQNDWIIGDITNETMVTEALGDMVGGVFIEVQISVEYAADRCSIDSTTTFE